MWSMGLIARLFHWIAWIKMNKLFTIFGLKLAKREPWVKDGIVIDDGTNQKISLCSNVPEDLADFFLANMKEQYHGKAWKIWKEETKS